MQTNIHESFSQHPDIAEAEAILRSCVHCGFCTATCPTYQLLSDERDGPRGRIYLLKQFLETNQITEKTQEHLDRCLTCRSCETTCPSGVDYSRLLDIGRSLMEEKLPRSGKQRLLRRLVRSLFPFPSRLMPLLTLAQLIRPVLPSTLASKVPVKAVLKTAPAKKAHARTMIALAGCVQSSATPNTLRSSQRVLDKLNISLVTSPTAGCCGALSYHLSAPQEGLDFMRRNIDAWWPLIEQGAEAIVITATGCGAMVKEYGDRLKDDPYYADKALKVSALSKDISEILLSEDLSSLKVDTQSSTAVHCPCSMQHALKLNNNIEKVLTDLGFNLSRTQEKHLCCGSAGTYSIFQPEISEQLLAKKVSALTLDKPDQIVTANIGCQLHIGSQSAVPVKHWIELLDS